MLSPSMITNSKGNVPCSFNISSATSNWPLPPVPLSPITAKRTDFGFKGSFSASAAVSGKPHNTSRTAKRFISSRYGIFDEVDNQVGVYIAQDQIVSDYPVIEFGRQRRQVHQQRGRRGL